MKTLLKALACLCTLFVLTGASCNKEDVLPPETQTGAYSFGCLINGKIFTAKGVGSDIDSYYQYIYPTGDNGFVFHISGKQKGSRSCEVYSIFINGDSIKVEEGKTYRIAKEKRGNFSGTYTYSPAYDGCRSRSYSFKTSDSQLGELKITKFDETNRIVSGIFWFDLVDTVGNPIQIREGRFDTKYTR